MSDYDIVNKKYTKEEKREYWNTAIGLQAVDGLDISDYLDKLKEEEIEGKITIDDVEKNLHTFYKKDTAFISSNEKEADMVSMRITKYLQEMEFILHPLALKHIHKFLYQDLKEFNPGEYREYNISKKEPILYGSSVKYEDYRNIEEYIDYDINKEIKKPNITIIGIAEFISGLWKIHPFIEGNTRTIAVFTIKYLNNLGYKIDNTPFKENAEFFRNALVRASYSNMQYHVHPNFEYIVKFFENVLLGKKHLLDSQKLVVHALNV